MNTVDTNQTTTTGCYGYCMYRLPCGYCKEMNSMCPFAGSWYMKITCGTSGTTCVNGKTMEVSFGGDDNAVRIINKADNVII